MESCVIPLAVLVQLLAPLLNCILPLKLPAVVLIMRVAVVCLKGVLIVSAVAAVAMEVNMGIVLIADVIVSIRTSPRTVILWLWLWTLILLKQELLLNLQLSLLLQLHPMLVLRVVLNESFTPKVRSTNFLSKSDYLL